MNDVKGADFVLKKVYQFSNIFILKLFETNFKEYQILMSKYNFEKISINNEKNKARIIIK